MAEAANSLIATSKWSFRRIPGAGSRLWMPSRKAISYSRGAESDADAGQVTTVTPPAIVGDFGGGQAGVGHDKQGVIRGPDARAAQADELDHAHVMVADLDGFADDEGPVCNQGERPKEILQRVLGPRAKARPPIPRPVSTAVMSQENMAIREKR